MNEKPLVEDIHYLKGQIDALMALVLAVAGSTMDKEAFRAQATARLESLENTLLHRSVPESHLAAVAHTKDWVHNVTG